MGASNTENLYVPTNIPTINTITWYDNKHSVWQKNTVVVKTFVRHEDETFITLLYLMKTVGSCYCCNPFSQPPHQHTWP